MTNNYGGSDGGYYWANSESDSEVVVSDYTLPRWFDAFCRIRFETEDIIERLKNHEIENPTIDDLILDIDFLLDDWFGRRSKDFVIYDSNGKEW